MIRSRTKNSSLRPKPLVPFLSLFAVECSLENYSNKKGVPSDRLIIQKPFYRKAFVKQVEYLEGLLSPFLPYVPLISPLANQSCSVRVNPSIGHF